MKQIKLITMLLLSCLITGVNAQNTLGVNEKNGTQTSFTFKSIRKLTFQPGNLIVNKTDGNMSTYELSDIRNLSFENLTTNVSVIDSQKNSNIMLYPNPVKDQLQISYNSSKAGILQIEIVDLQGKVLNQQKISSQKGTNHSIIYVVQLHAGLYFCRLQNGEKLETIKFLKN